MLEGVGAARAGAPVAFRIWVEAPMTYGAGERPAGCGDDLADWDHWSMRESAHFTADHTRERADLFIDGIPVQNAATIRHDSPD